MGGAVGAAVGSSARRAGGRVYHLDRLVVYVDPRPQLRATTRIPWAEMAATRESTSPRKLVPDTAWWLYGTG